MRIRRCSLLLFSLFPASLCGCQSSSEEVSDTTMTDNPTPAPHAADTSAEAEPERRTPDGGMTETAAPDPVVQPDDVMPTVKPEEVGTPPVDAGTKSMEAGMEPADRAAPLDVDTVCNETCALIGDFRLPSALCEDWGIQGAPRFEFCGLNLAGSSCEEYCVQGVESSSDACAAVLPDAVLCVAGTGFYTSPEIPPPGVCLYDGCVPEMLRVHDECTGMRQALASARELWAASSPERYGFTWRKGDQQARIDVQGEVAMVTSGAPLDAPPTIETLFDQIETVLDAEGRTVITSYDPDLGFPVEIAEHFPAVEMGCTGSERVMIEDFVAE
jgi:hypothetical protein